MSRPIALPLGIHPRQDDPRRGPEVERVDDPGRRDPHEPVAQLPRQAAQPLVFLAQDEDRPTGELHPVQILGAGLAGGPVDPEPFILEPAQRLGDIAGTDDFHVLQPARGDLLDHGRHPGRSGPWE